MRSPKLVDFTIFCDSPKWATIVYYDNINAIYLTSNLVQHQNTKHIEIEIHFVLGSRHTHDTNHTHSAHENKNTKQNTRDLTWFGLI